MAENLVLRLIARTAAFTRGMRTARTDVTRLSSSVKQSQAVMRSFAAVAGTGLGLHAVNRAVKSSVSEFAKFQKEMANVSTMLNKQQMKLLPGFSKQIERMSVKYGESTDTLSEGLYDILSASIDASEAMSVLEVSAISATAGLTSTAQSADAITSVLNSYSMEASQAAKVSSDLFETVQKGKITFSELSQDIGKVASLAATGGVSLEALLATVSTLTRAGLKSEMAMTGIKNIINSFVTKATPDAVAAAKELGFSFDMSALAGTGLIDIFTKLKGASIQQLGAIMPNVRGLVALSAGIRQADNAMRDLRYITNTSGADLEAFEKINATLAKDIDRMVEAFKSLARLLGRDLAGDVSKLSKAFVTMSEENSDLRELVKTLGFLAKWYMKLQVVEPFKAGTALVDAGKNALEVFDIDKKNKALEESVKVLKELQGLKSDFKKEGIFPVGFHGSIGQVEIDLDKAMLAVARNGRALLQAQKNAGLLPSGPPPAPVPQVPFSPFNSPHPFEINYDQFTDPIKPYIGGNTGYTGGQKALQKKSAAKIKDMQDQAEAYKRLTDSNLKYLEIAKFTIEAEAAYGVGMEETTEAIKKFSDAFTKMSDLKDDEDAKEKKRTDAKTARENVDKILDGMRREASLVGQIGNAWERSREQAELHAEAIKIAAEGAEEYNRIMQEGDKYFRNAKIAERWADVANTIESGLVNAFERVAYEGEKLGEQMKNLARSILIEMNRAMFLKPMAEAGSGILGDIGKRVLTSLLTGGATGGGGSSASNTASQQTNTMTAGYGVPVGHSGLKGKYGGIRRNVSGGMFASAPKLHKGLKSDEFPAILQTGEEVIPRGGNSKPEVSVVINNNGTAQQVDSQTAMSENGKMFLSLWTSDFQNEGQTFNAVKNSRGL